MMNITKMYVEWHKKDEIFVWDVNTKRKMMKREIVLGKCKTSLIVLFNSIHKLNVLGMNFRHRDQLA